MVLKDEQTGFWCHTLQMNVPEKIRYEPKGIHSGTYSLPIAVIHFAGGITKALNNVIQLNYRVKYISNVKVNLNALKMSTQDDKPCSDQTLHNQCLDETVNDVDLNCSLPFDVSGNNSICSTFDEGLSVVKTKLTLLEKCKEPCLQLQVDYKEEPVNFLMSLARFRYSLTFIESSEDTLGYIFHIPNLANQVSINHEYSLESALGYFGSIAGIFIGISVIKTLTWFIGLKNVKSEFNKWIIRLVHIGLTMYLIYVFIILLVKYIEFPKATSVNFAKTTSDFSITVCSSIPVYGLNVISSTTAVVSYDKFFMQNLSFWQTWSNPRTIMDTIKVDNGNDIIDLLKNTERKFHLLPINNQTLAPCKTFELADFGEIVSINIVYKKEIKILFHNSGQLLYEWAKQENQILPATNENVIKSYFKIEVYDTAVQIKFHKQSYLERQNHNSYDNCILDNGSKALNDTELKCFFSNNYTNCVDNISKSSLIQIENYLKNQDTCKPPGNILLTSAVKSLYPFSVDIDAEADWTSERIDTSGDLGIENQEEKPKIVLLFSTFTKLSQVSLFNHRIIYITR